MYLLIYYTTTILFTKISLIKQSVIDLLKNLVILRVCIMSHLGMWYV